MTKIPLRFNGWSAVRLGIDIHGTKVEEEVLLDTGFTTSSGFGLKIPMAHVQAASSVALGQVRLANGKLHPALWIPDGRITEINGEQVNFTLPTLFMDGPRVVGCMLLQSCKLHLDGPSGEGTLEF